MIEIEYMEGSAKHRISWFGSETDFRKKAAVEGKVILRCTPPTMWSRVGFKIRNEELVASLTALGDLLTSGVALSVALSTVASSFPKQSRANQIFMGVGNAVKSGASLSRAMENYPETFSTTTVSMVQSGEAAGKLPQTVAVAADHIREMAEIKREILQKMSYPAFVFVFGLTAMFINTVYIIPKIMNSELFKMSATGGVVKGAIFITILNALAKAIPIIIVLAVVCFISLSILFKFKQHAVEKIIIRVPIIRAFIFDRAYFNAFSALANLTAVGVRLEPAFEIVSGSMKLHMIRAEFEAARNAIKAGSRPSVGLKNLSPTERMMLDVSQSSERIKQNFEIISKRYYKSFVERVRSLGPKVYGAVLILVFGMFILMLLGVMLPYFSIIGGLH